MPLLRVDDGSGLPAAVEVIQRQSVIHFANATERAAQVRTPALGMLTFLEATKAYEWWNGTGWTPLPDTTGVHLVAYRGASGSISIAQGLTWTNLAALTATITSGRLYRLTLNIETLNTTAAAGTADHAQVGLDAPASIRTTSFLAIAGRNAGGSYHWHFTDTSGSHTYTARARMSVAVGTIVVGSMALEDLGPDPGAQP